MKKLSIIIPTFNSGETLARALKSILIQTFTDFELLIIDGLSIDNTVNIAKGFNDERIKIYSEKDNGIYDAMNKGISIANGEWLYFLGSDDTIYDNNVLYEIYSIVTSSKYDVIYGDVMSSRFNGRYDGMFTIDKILKQNICHQSIFFHKNVFKKTGNFKKEYKSYADWDHNMRWFLSNNLKHKYIDIIVANYADGGFSSINNDDLFSNEKNFNYLAYSKNILPFRQKLRLMKREFIKAKNQKNFPMLKKLVLLSFAIFVPMQWFKSVIYKIK